MNVCILGAGAVGTLIGARLARAGHAVSVVARGAALDAVAERGLRVRERDPLAAPGAQPLPQSEWSVGVRAQEDARAFGPQDLVVVAVKAPALASASGHLAPLLGPDTVVLPAMNGVPWWFFDVPGVPLSGLRLESVDPGGRIAAAIPAERVLGGVVHWASDCPEPGLARRNFGNRIIIGEPDGRRSTRLAAVAAALAQAGFEVEDSTELRREVWFKLWGNMTMNPLSAITAATVDRIIDDPLLVRFCIECMGEAAAIGERIGCPIEQSAQARIDIARSLGPFKTSMLQDVEAQRPVEIDALLSAVAEIAAKVGLPVPSIAALLGIARLHARVRGLYPAGTA